MTLTISQSESGGATGRVPEQEQEHRSEIPADLLVAAITGDNDVLVRRLGLPQHEQDLIEVKIEPSHDSTPQLAVVDEAAGYQLRSATQFGETVLHILLAKCHNKLALKVFENDRSLLKARNNNWENPLHYAAKVGNEEAVHNLIQLDSGTVKDALREANCKGDTALHVAVVHGHGGICCELMKLDRQMAYLANNKGFSALYIAILEGHTSMVEAMLQVYPTLASIQFSDGMFPVLVAAKMGNIALVKHFITNYPTHIEFVDPLGRNIYHMAAEQEERDQFVFELLESKALSGDHELKDMINATDYEGNTPLHIAATKGHGCVMKALWEGMTSNAREAPNKKGRTPFLLSMVQVENSSTKNVRN